MAMNTMNDLLTTHELEEILKVDRITIYRMLGDGRLKGFKVGGQWRFPRSEVESWIRGRCFDLDSLVSDGAGKNGEQASRILPMTCIQAVQSIFADAMGIAAVTTDIEGYALTEVSNSCDFCRAILSSKEGQRRCSAFWKNLGKSGMNTCHAGLLGAGERITTNGKWVGIVVGCQLDLQSGEGHNDVGWRENFSQLASELDLPEKSLYAAASGVRTIQADQLPRVTRLVKQVADTFSKIGEERLALLGRLERIAEITHFEP
jgi:excisionase family DNA binding protein